MFSNNSKNVDNKTAELSLPKDEDEELTEQFSDWKTSIAFNKKRHLENIEGGNKLTQTWRMKERVSQLFYINVFLNDQIFIVCFLQTLFL